FWPELRWHAALVWLAAVGCGALLSPLLTRQRLSTAWLAGLRTPPRGIADAFATWLEVGGAASDPMVQWLASDLDARVRTLSAPQLAGVGRRRAFDRRWLMFAVLAVLLAWLLAWWLAPNWPGALGGRPQPPPPPPPVAGGGAGAGAPQ